MLIFAPLAHMSDSMIITFIVFDKWILMTQSQHLDILVIFNLVRMYDNIAFARGGAHLSIAHALRLLSTQELRFGLTKLNLRKKRKKKKNLARGFFWNFFLAGGQICFKFFKSFLFLFLDEIEIEKKIIWPEDIFFERGGKILEIC